ncbi:sensor histidine kinase [Sodalis ligni]|uniref:histidine kinase n=1 Tax=Sodalis ligni TaxID=2697027 RepID=A0A4R1NB50_9GAMM|nr:HAMP domain-containing sensor histidine kinase [Sodalis ligni]TCL04523.1 signal transduction histidine kinase [Sodalis ligni]
MFRYWISSLSARLWLISVAALALSLPIITAIVLYVFNQFPEFMWQRDKDMKTAQEVAAGLRFDDSGRPASIVFDQQTAWLVKTAASEILYRVCDEAGNILLQSPQGRLFGTLDSKNLANEATLREKVMIDGRRFDLVTLGIDQQGTRFYVQVATSEIFNKAIMNLKLKPIPEIFGWSLFITMILFSLTFPFTVRRVMRPVRVASGAAASITPANLKTRLSYNDIPSEIKPLLLAFNDALARLENGFKVQQEFLASAAHELQTPLTLIRGQIELQPEIKDKELLFFEIDLMARHVRQLLHLAEVSESQNYHFSGVDTVDVAQDVVEYLARKADKNQVKLQVDAPDALPLLTADRSALFILLKNIIENAINVTPPYGAVSVAISDSSIQVQDSGPGIKAEYLPFLFDRFWRAPDAVHEGAGLGLSICKEIAVAHRWRLSVTPSAPGTRFIVWF